MVAHELKRHTARQHASLDDKLSARLAAITPPAYLALIERLYGLYAPAEHALQALSPALAAQLGMDGRRKAPLLAADIALLGGAPAHELPLCGRLAPLAGDAALLGCLYVLEGATLGGQIILRRLGARLGLRADHGASFFASYGPDVGPRWRQFQATVAAYAEQHPAGAPAMLDAAARTFACFDEWLFEPAPAP